METNIAHFCPTRTLFNENASNKHIPGNVPQHMEHQYHLSSHHKPDAPSIIQKIRLELQSDEPITVVFRFPVLFRDVEDTLMQTFQNLAPCDLKKYAQFTNSTRDKCGSPILVSPLSLSPSIIKHLPKEEYITEFNLTLYSLFSGPLLFQTLHDKGYISQGIHNMCFDLYYQLKGEYPPLRTCPDFPQWIGCGNGFQRIQGPLVQNQPHTISIDNNGRISYSCTKYDKVLALSSEELRGLDIPPVVLEQLRALHNRILTENQTPASLQGGFWNWVRSWF
jgi:hypothetical protein